jgi:hypothetical protein
MKKKSQLVRVLLFISIVCIALLSFSCSQYEYSSPEPGILDIRLKTKNSRTAFMPFGQGSSFFFNVKSLEVFDKAGNRLPVLPDLNAIRRSVDGDFFNSLDTLARDSALVLGKSYAPPTGYNRIEIVAQINIGGGNEVVVPNVGNLVRRIQVIEPLPPPPALNTLPREGERLSFQVDEGRVTVVNVMLDLDSTLIRQTETFLGDLQFYISSIQNK